MVVTEKVYGLDLSGETVFEVLAEKPDTSPVNCRIELNWLRRNLAAALRKKLYPAINIEQDEFANCL
jgi:hypothetical protein